VTLGEYSFIGAGSVVTTDIPAYALIVGVPGRQIGWMCECGTTLESMACGACGKRYIDKGDTIERVSDD
jgi:UDP-2-acetamido-3-amino-2,3-dideoxy-glucuronate N-acetyltransferase